MKSILGLKPPVEIRQGKKADSGSGVPEYFRRASAESPRSVQLTLALAPRVIDVDDFQFAVKVDGRGAGLALADSGRLHPAERDVSFAAHRRRVNVDHSAFQPFGRLKH